MKKIIACLLLLCLLLPLAAAEEIGYDKVYDTQHDAGRLSLRLVWLGEKIAEDKPGDCMILTSPDGKIMVLDTGHPGATGYVLDALETMGVEKIDYLVLSHPHIDHIGGAAKLMDTYPVEAIYTSPLWYNSGTYAACMAAISRNNVPHVILTDGMTLQFGEDVLVEVLNPPAEIEYPKNYPEGSTDFVNNHSLALKFTYGTSTMLLCGDLYMVGEREVLERWGDKLDSDVHKPNHHGAATSTSSKWRKTVSAKVVVMSNYTLADYYVAKKFDKESDVYHTYVDGDLLVYTAGDSEYEVVTVHEHKEDRFL